MEKDEFLYPNRPTVEVDGVKINHKQAIEGKSLEVYEFLAENPGEHGVREIQRQLGYSSPSVVYYHLNKLTDLDYVSQNTETSQYYVIKNEVDLGNVGTHIRFMKYWVPRSLFYAISLVGLIILSAIYIISGVDSPMVWFVSISSVLVILISLLLRDSIHFSRKFRQT